MSIYVYELLDPVTQAVIHAGSSHRPSEIYQEHLDGECVETAAIVNDMLAQGRLPVMKIVSEHDTWNAARRCEKKAKGGKTAALPAAPFQASAPWQQGFASFM